MVSLSEASSGSPTYDGCVTCTVDAWEAKDSAVGASAGAGGAAGFAVFWTARTHRRSSVDTDRYPWSLLLLNLTISIWLAHIPIELYAGRIAECFGTISPSPLTGSSS